MTLDHILLDGDPAPFIKGHSSPPLFGPLLLPLLSRRYFLFDVFTVGIFPFGRNKT